MNLRTDKEFRIAVRNLRDDANFRLLYARLQVMMATTLTALVIEKDDPEYSIDRRRGRAHMLHDLLLAVEEARTGQPK